MREQIDILVKLQKIETEVERIQSVLKDIPNRIESLDSRLNEFEKTMEEETSEVNELKKKYRACESDVKINSSALDKNKERLLSIKNNKEYQALLKSIEEIEAKNSQIEDEMLSYLDRMEESEKAITARKKEYSDLKKKITSEKDKLTQEEVQGKKKLILLEKELGTVSKQIESRLLKAYISVKQKVGRLAIASVEDAICGGCKMKIPPQMYNELHRLDSLKSCPHCQRLIYWEQTDNNRSE